VGVQQVRWDRGSTEPAGEHTCFYGKWNENHELGTGFLVHKRIISAVKSIETVSDTMSYIILRGCWYDITILNIHIPTEEKIDDAKDSFYEKFKHIFNIPPKYHMKTLLGDFNAKVGREDIFKTTGNESFHEISNDNGIRSVNFATSKKYHCRKYYSKL
jgi:hypothetical protein